MTVSYHQPSHYYHMVRFIIKQFINGFIFTIESIRITKNANYFYRYNKKYLHSYNSLIYHVTFIYFQGKKYSFKMM